MISLHSESSAISMSSPPILMSMIQAAPAGQAGGTAAVLFQIFPFIIVFAIFYLLWIRPQQQRVKQHQAAINAVKKGDEVVTGGGIRGRVTKVAEDEAEVEIAQGVKIRVIKSTITQVLSPTTKPAND
jgi:preprotein translocase subunit YajC